MTENVQITKAAGTVGTFTLISRILGYVRDIIIAGFFGAGPIADAFIAAFRIPNLLRRLFGEGTLSVSIIPVFTDYINNKGREEAFELALSALRFLAALLALLVIIGVLAAPWIVKTIAFGFSDIPEKFALTVTLTRIMIPYVFFIGMVALCTGLLNVLGHFAAPAIAPILLNIAMIGSVLIVSFITENPEIRVYTLAAGVVAGGILQLALQIPFLIRKGINIRKTAGFFHSGLKKIGARFLPVIIGASVFQINTLTGSLLASFCPEGSITYLYFADRMVQFPLGVFGIAVAIAVLPSFSRLAVSKDIRGMIHIFGYSMKIVVFITIPSMIGLIILREPIVAFLFQRGAFDAQATELTALALLYYSVGLWAFAAVRIVIGVFFAVEDTKTPIRMAGISIFANIIMGVLLMRFMGHSGIALSLSLASMLNLVLLICTLRIKLGPLGLRTIIKTSCKTVLSSLLMGLVVWAFYHLSILKGSGSVEIGAINLLGCIIAGVFTYGVFSYILNGLEIKMLLQMIINGIRQR